MWPTWVSHMYGIFVPFVSWQELCDTARLAGVIVSGCLQKHVVFSFLNRTICWSVKLNNFWFPKMLCNYKKWRIKELSQSFFYYIHIITLSYKLLLRISSNGRYFCSEKFMCPIMRPIGTYNIKLWTKLNSLIFSSWIFVLASTH